MDAKLNLLQIFPWVIPLINDSNKERISKKSVGEFLIKSVTVPSLSLSLAHFIFSN